MFVFKAAVVGAGTMGGEIACAIASAGIPVVLKDVEERLVGQGIDAARSIWQGKVEAGRMTPEALERQLALIEGATAYDGFGDVDFAIEAVPDELELKQQVLAELDDATPGHAILASATSKLPIGELAEATSRPGKVVGFHFLRPASAVRLVEVVEGFETDPETVRTAMSFAQAIRKTPIRCDDAPGFVVDRVLAARAAAADDEERVELATFVEACLVLEEGVASTKDVDVGLAAGAGIVPPPFTRADATGLDELLERLERAAEKWGEQYAPPALLRRLVAQGRLGRESGQGFFAYPRPGEGWDEGPVKLETRGAIAIAWLDRPPANSLSPETIGALRRVWDRVDGDPQMRALVVASANPNLFCAGADIKAFTQMDAAGGRALLDETHDLFRAFERSSVATIAAVNGLALGGGCELAMACDVRLAAESASFGQPEINLGIIPGFGGTQRLPRLVGEARALELNLTGEPVSAIEAYEIGLVNRVLPDHELFDAALAWARKLAAMAPLAVEQIKRVSGQGNLDEGIAAEKQGFATVFASEDAMEGIGAFLQKRSPRFQGR